MTLAIATFDLAIAWCEFEDALSTGAENVSEKAAAWWRARENYRLYLLENAVDA